MTTLLNGVPIGTILPYGGLKDERALGGMGFLFCDGSAVSQEQYPDLFEVIGQSFGQGNTTSFILPDLRGYFLRGVDEQTKHDPDANTRTTLATGGNSGDEVGSYQSDALALHDHGYWRNDLSGKKNVAPGVSFSVHEKYEGTDLSGNTSETRPKNVYVYFIIKAFDPSSITK